jgi:hypothetical protein
MTVFTEILEFEVDSKERELFKSGKLWQEWHRRYPEIFDDDDLRLAQNQAHLGYHYCEWQAAIFLYEKTGYRSLVEKYHFRRHKNKQNILRKLVSPELLLFIADKRYPEFGRVQVPDLLVYKPNYSDWFFCEVKGPNDRVRKVQERYFEQLARVSKKPIWLVRLKLPKRGEGLELPGTKFVN